MKKILIVLGTRPEAIKLLPILWELKKQAIPFHLLNTNQHGAILDDLLASHQILPDDRLDVCQKFPDLLQTKLAMLSQMSERLSDERFSFVMVQGDTLSALTGAEYAFFQGMRVAHVEAGMRTFCPDNPYPEEGFRQMISAMAHLHFCPSEDERSHLLRQGIPSDRIFVTGNPFVDYWKKLSPPREPIKKQILLTLHRRENLPALPKLLDAISALARRLCDYRFLFPLHPNPLITESARERLGGLFNVSLLPPLPPDLFYRELCASAMVITDSGGVHEECILHAKKVLILRDRTERRSDFDFTELVSPTDPHLEEKFFSLLQRKTLSVRCDYYGDGRAAPAIVEQLKIRA